MLRAFFEELVHKGVCCELYTASAAHVVSRLGKPLRQILREITQLFNFMTKVGESFIAYLKVLQ